MKENILVDDCIKKHGLEEPLGRLGRKQNNYTHNNGRSFLIDNLLTYHDVQKFANLLEQASNDITFITSFFLTILILIRSDYISSDDYIDYLECNIDPPNECQYWIAPIAQEYINLFVVTLHPELKVYLNEKNPYGMLID